MGCPTISYHVSVSVIIAFLISVNLPIIIHSSFYTSVYWLSYKFSLISVYPLSYKFLLMSVYRLSYKILSMSVYRLSYKFSLTSVYRLSYKVLFMSIYQFPVLYTFFFTHVNVPFIYKFLPMLVYRLLKITYSCRCMSVTMQVLIHISVQTAIASHKFLPVSLCRLSKVLTFISVNVHVPFIRQVLPQVSVPAIIQRPRVYEIIFTWRRVFGSWNLPCKRHREIFAETSIGHDEILVLAHKKMTCQFFKTIY